MTKDDILGMVLKAGGSFCHQHSDSDRSIYMSFDEITRFVELVKQHEREECAKVCDNEESEWSIMSDGRYAARWCASQIRERQ